MGGGISVGANSSGRIDDVGGGPCLSCGGELRFLDGLFANRGGLIEVLQGPELTIETLRTLGLLFADAAKDGTGSDEVIARVQDLAPSLIGWLQKNAPAADTPFGFTL